MAVTLVLNMRDQLARTFGPVGAPPFRVALQIRLGDRVDGLLAEVANEVAANHGGLALALVGSALASFHLTEDLRDKSLATLSKECVLAVSPCLAR